MKLCIVTPSVIKGDGQGRANYEIVLEAIRCGHHITLITSRVDQSLLQNDRIKCISISVEEKPTALLRGIIFSWQSSDWLRKHRHEFDLIQVYGCVTSVPGDINTAQFVHSGWLKSPVHVSRVRKDFYGTYQWLYTALNAYWEKKSFRQAKVVVAVSENIKKQLVDIGIPKEYIEVIYNGVDLHEFSPGSTDRNQLELPERVTLALFVGDIRTNRKNLDTVLHALVQVSGLHLAVVGNTKGSPYLQLANELSLNERVHFLGYRPDVAEIMRAADIFVFPSRYEPFGMVVSEAMASGLPVVTSATTGAAEIVTSECGVVLSNSEDTKALVQALSKLKNNRELRCQMGQAARAIAKQHSWETKAKSYINLFEEINLEKDRNM